MKKLICTTSRIKDMQNNNRIWVCLGDARDAAEKLNNQYGTDEFTVVKVVEHKTECEYGYTIVSVYTM